MNKEAELSFETKIKETSWDYTSPSDVGVALVDLNDDHTPEIVSLITSRAYSTAVGGYELVIYSQIKGELHPITTKIIYKESNGRHLPLETGVQISSRLAKVSHKTNGYHDLAWFVEKLSAKQSQKHFLVWDKEGHYIYGKSEKITDKERGIFKSSF